MELILIIGPQAVGKMSVGLELEKYVDAKLLFNHETIDIFARFLGYIPETFRLSELVRKELFHAFVCHPETNQTRGIIFTAVIAFDQEEDWSTLKTWAKFFTSSGGKVFIIELEAKIEERLKRNVEESRLAAKPSKRDIDFSKKELLETAEKHRLKSYENEITDHLPDVEYLKIENTGLEPEKAASQISSWLNNKRT